MKRLKLFEDFEEKSYYEIDSEDWLSYYEDGILFNEYPFSNLYNTLKKRLANVFGHSDFYFEVENKKFNAYPESIHIYERLNSLVYYNIYLIENEWFFVKSQNRVLGLINLNHYYKCDDIKGMIDAIKYDYEEINKIVGLYYKLPSRERIYGIEKVKKQFFNAENILLDTFKSFPISDFPEEEVNKIIPEIYLPNDYDWGPVRRKEFLDQKVDGKFAKLTWNNKTLDLYYIKETNRFNCADLYNTEYFACLGTEGLKSLLKIFYKDI
jgi:uncharacterized protein YeeX (DUF496 family)